jgi:transposase
MTNASRRKKGMTTNDEKVLLSDVNDYIPSSKSIDLLPTFRQKKVLNDWIAAVRKVKNVSLQSIYKDKTPWSEEILRNKFVIHKNVSNTMRKKLEWTFRTPKRVREYAIKDLITSYKSCNTRLKKKQIKKFRIKPTSRFKNVQTINIPHESTYIKLLPEQPYSEDNQKRNIKILIEKPHLCLSGMSILMKEDPGISELSHNMRLTRRDGRYILHIPEFKELKVNTYYPSERIVSIDPGIRIPFTWYCPDGEWGETGLGLKQRLNSIYSKEEQLLTRLTNKKKLRKAMYKLNRKKFNMIDDFQWKSIHWFLQRFKTVVIPTLYVARASKLLKKQQADIRHCEFVKRIIHKSMFYEGRNIHVAKEHGTSALCTGCRSLLPAKDEEMICNVCDLVIHRDLGASRSILVKHLD